MNGAEFFMAHFGRHFGKPTGNAIADAARVLRSSHATQGGPSRFVLGNHAAICPGRTLLKGKFLNTAAQRTELTWSELVLQTLRQWDGTPALLLKFDKVLFPVEHLLVSYDLRRVRLCSAKRVADIDGRRILDAAVADAELNADEQALRRAAKALARKEAARAAC